MTAEAQARYAQSEKGLATMRRYEASEKAKATRRKAKAAWKERNRARIAAHHRAMEAVRRAVRSGVLLRSACWCGEENVQAHHPNGYGPEHQLDVVWLCVPHHRKAHDR